MTRIEPILQEIRKFAQLAPQEILFVDFHRFPFPRNFSQDLHRQFTELVYQHLGQHVVNPAGLQAGSGPTLNEIWSQNRSVVVSYADRATVNRKFSGLLLKVAQSNVSETPWLWHPIKQFWGDTNKLGTLKQYLYSAIYQHKSSTNPMWALMMELTPQPWDVVLRKNSLRDLAQSVNRQVTRWVRDEWFNDVNIVATDYFLGNDLVRVAIEVNKANPN